VAYCTHGMGRSGRVAAGWLVHKYGLSVEEAVDEALEAARIHGVERMGSPRQLKSGWQSNPETSCFPGSVKAKLIKCKLIAI
jgi:protein-tyrosine phosphatase